MKRRQIRATVQIPEQRVRVPGEKVQVFAAILTLLENSGLWGPDQEFVWRQVGLWKGFKVQS